MTKEIRYFLGIPSSLYYPGSNTRCFGKCDEDLEYTATERQKRDCFGALGKMGSGRIIQKEKIRIEPAPFPGSPPDRRSTTGSRTLLPSIDRKFGRINDPPQDKTRMNARDPLDLSQPVQEKILKMSHVPDDDLQQVVGFLAGDEVARLNFGIGPDLILECLETFGDVPVHPDMDHDRESESQLFGIEKGDPFLNDARFLQGVNPAEAGRGGKGNLLRQGLIADSCVTLQFPEDLAVEFIEPEIFDLFLHMAIFLLIMKIK